MASFVQRLQRSLKATAKRSLELNLAIKRRIARRGHCLFVTSPSKTGSTYLVTLLEEATGYLRYFLGAAFEHEQNLYLPKLIDSWSLNVICQHHTRATPPDLKLMREFSVRPVILTRDIFDCAVSLCDYIGRMGGHASHPYVKAGFLGMPRSRQLDAIIDCDLPWYFLFVAGWQQADIDKLWLRYEDMVGNPAAALARVLDFHRITYAQADLVDVVERCKGRTDYRFNKGVQGRGRQELTAEQQARIRSFARHYPGVDFTCLGIMPGASADSLPQASLWL
jgi:hypothetical protein